MDWREAEQWRRATVGWVPVNLPARSLSLSWPGGIRWPVIRPAGRVRWIVVPRNAGRATGRSAGGLERAGFPVSTGGELTENRREQSPLPGGTLILRRCARPRRAGFGRRLLRRNRRRRSGSEDDRWHRKGYCRDHSPQATLIDRFVHRIKPSLAHDERSIPRASHLRYTEDSADRQVTSQRLVINKPSR